MATVNNWSRHFGSCSLVQVGSSDNRNRPIFDNGQADGTRDGTPKSDVVIVVQSATDQPLYAHKIILVSPPISGSDIFIYIYARLFCVSIVIGFNLHARLQFNS